MRSLASIILLILVVIVRSERLISLVTRNIKIDDDGRHVQTLVENKNFKRHYISQFSHHQTLLTKSIEMVCFENSDPENGINHHYLGSNSYIIYCSTNHIEKLIRNHGLQWYTSLLPIDKLGLVVPNSSQKLINMRYVVFETSYYIEPLYLSKSLQCKVSFINKEGTGYRIPYRYVASKCKGENITLMSIAAMDEVLWVREGEEPNVMTTAAQWITQSNHNNHLPIWDLGVTGIGEVIAVGDTGLDYESCFFSDPNEAISFFPNTSNTHRKIVSYSQSDCECVENGATSEGLSAPFGDSTDQINGHGTHAAGCISGIPTGVKISDNYQGVGLAPESKLFIQDLEDLTLPTTILRNVYPGHSLRLKYYKDALLVGAMIHSSSWGTSPPLGADDLLDLGGYGPRISTPYGTYSHDTDLWVWNHKQYLPIFASGNDGRRGSRTISAPGNAKNVLTVGSLELGSSSIPYREDVAYFSSTGPTFDGRIKPDVIAPGTAVTAAYSDNGKTQGVCLTSAHSGSSVSTPLVAASVALLRQYLREGRHSNSVGQPDPTAAIAYPSAALLKALIIAGTVSVNGVKKQDFNDPVGRFVNETWPSWIAGYGSIKLSSIMTFNTKLSSYHNTWFESISFSNSSVVGSSYYWCFQVLDTPDIRTPLTVALAYTDYPASLFASSALVTNINLILHNDDGQTWKGNSNITGEVIDTKNNVEAIRIDQPVPGYYMIQIVLQDSMADAVKIDGGQPASIAVTGPIGGSDSAMCPKRRCPNDCSGTGVCRSSNDGRLTCSCLNGYRHADCSVPTCGIRGDSECNNHGCYDTASLTCTCHTDNINGFWSGSNCNQCASSHEGLYQNGTLRCHIEKMCSANGLMTNTPVGGGLTIPHCNCQASPATGWWGGWSCTTCAEGYSGSTCRCSTPYCNGHGRCTDSGCLCDTNDHSGHWAHNITYSDCTICESGWYGPTCKCTSPTCSGHGTCTDGGCVCLSNSVVGHWNLSNYTCSVCETGWTGAGCNCKVDSNRNSATVGQVCGGHGVCETAAGCTCERSVLFGLWTSTSEGVCNSCASGAYGTGCRCLDLQCGGHGICTGTGCVCDKSDLVGHWQSRDGTCTTCTEGWFGVSCRCRSPDCDGHGDCLADGCRCYQTIASTDTLRNGYYTGDGTSCNTCLAGWSVYPSCLCATPDCDGHGRCTADGCVCQQAQLSQGIGAWSSSNSASNCRICAPGYAGTDCTCAAENCAQIFLNGADILDQSSSVYTYTVLNTTYQSSVHLSAAELALVPSDATLEIMIKLIREDSSDHPRKSGIQKKVFLENAFRWTHAVDMAAAITTDSPSSNTTTVGNQTEMLNNGRHFEILESNNDDISFTTYIEITTTWVHTPEKQTASLGSASLYILGKSGWLVAKTTCPQHLQQEETSANAQTTVTRVCVVSSDVVFAVFADEATPDYTIYYVLVGIGIVLLLSLVMLLLVHRLRRRLAREKKERQAKDLVIRFMQERRDQGPSLRERLRLNDGDAFTEEIAAQRILAKLQKKRDMFVRLMNRKEFNQIKLLTKALIGIELQGDSSKNINALTSLTSGERAIKKIWEFREDELHLLEACRLLRGMMVEPSEGPDGELTESPFLKPGVAPRLQRELIETKAENVKLRRVLLAMKSVDPSVTSVASMFQPKQSVIPEPKPKSKKVTHVPQSTFSDIIHSPTRSQVQKRPQSLRSQSSLAVTHSLDVIEKEGQLSPLSGNTSPHGFTSPGTPMAAAAEAAPVSPSS